jgi:hypothetical protein
LKGYVVSLSEQEERQFKNLTKVFALDTISPVETKTEPKVRWSRILLAMACLAIVATVAASMADNLLMVSLGAVSAVGLGIVAYVREEEEIYLESLRVRRVSSGG